MYQPWPQFLCVVLAIHLARVEVACGQDAAQLRDQQAKQRHAQAEADLLARRMAANLRVMQFYGIEDAEQQQAMALTLGQLRERQMAEVIRKLQAAIQTPDPRSAEPAIAAAYESHRKAVDALKQMLHRYETFRSLEQAAERLERASQQQLAAHLDLHLRLDALETKRPEVAADRQAVLDRDALRDLPVRKQRDEQSDLLRDVELVVQKLQGLGRQLDAGQRLRLEALSQRFQERGVLQNLAATLRSVDPPDGLTAESLRKASGMQWQNAVDLVDAAGALRRSGDAAEVLREVRERLGQAIAAQQAAPAEVRQQAQLEFDAHVAARLLKPLAAPASSRVQAARNAMRDAKHALAKGDADATRLAQQQAVHELQAARQQVDELLAQAERQKLDPLAVALSMLDKLDQVARAQQSLRSSTVREDAQPSDAAELSKQQQHLADQTYELQAQTSSSEDPSLAPLRQAEAAMRQAVDALEQNQRADAGAKQAAALESLALAKQALQRRAQTLQDRRADVDKLAALAKQLADLAREQQQVAAQAQALDPSEAPAQRRLADRQAGLLPAAVGLVRSLYHLAPTASAAIQESIANMEYAKQELDRRQPRAAATEARQAAEKLAEAQQALQKALAKLRAQELAEEAGAPGVSQAVAQQVAQALDLARKAAAFAEAAQAPQASAAAARNLAESQRANQAAQAALAQALAQPPPSVLPQFQQAEAELARASDSLKQADAGQASRRQAQAAEQLDEALATIKAALALRPQASSPKSSAKAKPKPGPPGPGEDPPAEQAGNGRQKAPASTPKGADGTGESQADGQGSHAASDLGRVEGQENFLHLPPRQRELIRQAISGQVPPEYAEMIHQFTINLARGRPAVSPRR